MTPDTHLDDRFPSEPERGRRVVGAPAGLPERDESVERGRRDEWLQKAIRRRDARLAEMEEKIDEHRRQLDSVFASTSWRVTAPLRAFSRRQARIARFLRGLVRVLYWSVTLRLPRRLRARRAAREAAVLADRERRERSYERWIDAYDTITADDLDSMSAMARALEYAPLVSVLMPVFNSPERFLREAIDSVRAQVYDNWELCIADDASTAPHVTRVLEEYEQGDDRVRLVQRPVNGGISAASNSALELARGELVAFADHDDVLRPHALLMAVRAFGVGRDIGYAYSDEDQIDEKGNRFGHNFKPDWNPALLLSQNYVCHFSVIRTELVWGVGGFRSEFDGSQDWDLALRITARLPADAIAHVPHILYHWRAIPGSAAFDIAEKPYAIDAARRATTDHLNRAGQKFYIAQVGSHQSVRYALPDEPPRVSVIVPSTGNPRLLESCLRGLLRHTDYPSLDVIIAVSESARTQPRRKFLEQLQGDSRVRVCAFSSRPFNYSWVVNWAVAQARGELVLLLNDDIEVIVDDWLEAMVGHVLQDGVGAVGAMLLYPDDTIQHAGVLLGDGDVTHLYRGRPAGTSGYVNRAKVPRDVSAVTGACMLVRRDVFDELGGLDEQFAVAYNDIDFCLRLRSAGWRVVFVPDAVLTHRESASFGTHSGGRERAHDSDVELMRERWGAALADDPMHNPNLALDASFPSRLAFPPRVAYPWREPPTAGAVTPLARRHVR